MNKSNIYFNLVIIILCFSNMLSGQITGKNWISQLPQSMKNKSIASITIPGTHDSGTKNLPIAFGTQYSSIEEQLNFGVRFLDIRLNNGLFIAHGVAPDPSQPFSSVLNTCSNFLKKNPNEFIIMSVKEETTVSLPAWALLMTTEITSNKNLFYDLNNKKIPTINEAKGKIVLLSRFSNPDAGIRFDVSDNTPDDEIGKNGNTIYVQDRYDIDLQQSYRKEAIVKDFLKKAASNSNEDALFINFTSAVGSLYGLPNPKKLADEDINPFLMKELDTQGRNRYGCILMDCINADHAKKIYENNFPISLGEPITDVIGVSRGSKSTADSDVRGMESKGWKLFKGQNNKAVDFNAGASGHHIYILYKTGSGTPLTGLKAYIRESSMSKTSNFVLSCDDGAMTDFNNDAGGKYIYLEKIRNSGEEPIRKLGVANFSTASNLVKEENGASANFNRGIEKGDNIYLKIYK